MSRILKENLLRTFFSLSAEAALKLSQGKVEGILLRRNIIRTLSDISLAETSPVPLEPAPHVDSVLQILEQYGIEKEGRKVLPVFDSVYELQNFWGRAEIIKAFEALPTITAWQPPKVERPATPQPPLRAKLYDLLVSPPENPPGQPTTPSYKKPLEIKISLKRSSEISTPPQEEPTTAEKNPPEKQKTEKQENKTRNFNLTPPSDKNLLKRFKTELEQGKLAILALEALGLPLLAIDLEGNEFFHNEEWAQLLARYGSRFTATEICLRAQNVIAERASQGNLEVNDTLEIPGLLKGRSFFLRTIRNDNKRTIGYLIWGEQNRSSLVRPLSDKPAEEKDSRHFLGRTLTEILAEEEKKALLWAYEQADGNQSNAAMLLGIPRQTYAYRLKKVLRQDKLLRAKTAKSDATEGYAGAPLKNQDTK